jgi:regulator of replication initiation timing
MRVSELFCCVLVLGACSLSAQNAPNPQQDSLADTLRELQSQIRELQGSVQELREEAARYRAETNELRKELAKTGTSPNGVANPQQPQTQLGQSDEQRMTKLEEDLGLLTGKVDEQYQTKVESASKYRVRLSGIVLFNLFSDRGVVDSVDNPTLARPRNPLDSGGTFGGTMRQSIFGLEVFGPQIAGARTSADVQFDFAGGFPNTPNGITFGLMRLRTARVRLQWTNTSLIAGQDTLFFAPLTPTSLASLSTPPLAYAGNLWAWVPQLRVEHKVSLPGTSSLNVAAGILDGITGEPPVSEYSRPAQAGEKSGQPAYAARVAWTHGASDRPLTLGVGGYYNRQNWGFGRTIDGWAATSDIEVPLGRWFSVSGELYRGRAIGGLGGGIGQTVLFSGDLTSPETRVLGLNSVGGWAQLKFTATRKLEFNGAIGQDNPFATDLHEVLTAQSYFRSALARNREEFVNVIARPRSDLVLSLEYRRLHTFELPRNSEIANQINLSAGVLF